MRPPYYRGCWHGVSRRFLWRYRHNLPLFEENPFFPPNRPLHSLELHQSRGVAASAVRPLRKIPHCCLPEESGPYLSPSVADHPLRSAIHRSLGEPLPHQQANGAQAHPQARGPEGAPSLTTYPCGSAALSGISPALAGLYRAHGQVAYVLLTRSPL